MRGRAGVHAEAARRTLARVAHRSLRHQAARVHRVERHVGANGRVQRGAQFAPGYRRRRTKAAGEIYQRLLLLPTPQHLHSCLKGGELPVRREQIELAIVLAECGAGSGRFGRSGSSSPAPPRDRLSRPAMSCAAVVGKILQHVHRAVAKLENGDDIRGGHSASG